MYLTYQEYANSLTNKTDTEVKVERDAESEIKPTVKEMFDIWLIQSQNEELIFETQYSNDMTNDNHTTKSIHREADKQTHSKTEKQTNKKQTIKLTDK